MAKYQVTHFQKELVVEGPRSFGRIVIFYERSQKDLGLLSLEAFLAVSHILESDPVHYDTVAKRLSTPKEPTKFQGA